MDFFKQKWVQYVAWAMVAAGIILLVLGGNTEEGISTGIKLIFGLIVAAGAVIAYICGKQDKLEKKDK